MARDKRIRYGVDLDTDMVISQRLDNFECAWPILVFEGANPDNNWQMDYELEKIKSTDIPNSVYYNIKWTRKIPIKVKNVHRKFWGMKPLKESE